MYPRNNQGKVMGGQYRICPSCGAAIDPGEHCECERPKEVHEKIPAPAELIAELKRKLAV